MQSQNLSIGLDKFEAILPVVKQPLPNGFFVNQRLELDGAIGYWNASASYPVFQMQGPWTISHEQLWRSVGNPALRYLASADEDLSFLVDLNDELRSLILVDAQGYENAISKLSNLRTLILDGGSEDLIDFTNLNRLRFLTMNFRDCVGFEHLTSLQSFSTGGKNHPESLNYLRTFTELKWLVLAQSRRVQDLTALNELSSLEWLWLQGLPKVSRLPNLSIFSELKRLELFNLIHATVDVSELLELESLELFRAFRVNIENLEKLKLRQDVSIGIAVSQKDLGVDGKYHWMSDRYVGEYD